MVADAPITVTALVDQMMTLIGAHGGSRSARKRPLSRCITPRREPDVGDVGDVAAMMRILDSSAPRPAQPAKRPSLGLTMAHMCADQVLQRSSVTLGILAGGRATRLAGRDKAWLQRGGVPQVIALVDALAPTCGSVLVSANRDIDRYRRHDLHAVADRSTDLGPLAGLDALAAASRSEWLLTVPVDVLLAPRDLASRLFAYGERGAFAIDDDGPQPLIALWSARALQAGSADAITSGNYAVHALQTHLRMVGARFDDMRFGNLNTPADLAAAGIDA